MPQILIVQLGLIGSRDMRDKIIIKIVKFRCWKDICLARKDISRTYTCLISLIFAIYEISKSNIFITYSDTFVSLILNF